MKLAPYAKAIVAAGTGFLGAYVTAVSDGVVTTSEWVFVAVTTLVSGAAVFGVPNKDPEATHQQESVQPPRGFQDRL
jgi:hypothetical protein